MPIFRRRRSTTPVPGSTGRRNLPDTFGCSVVGAPCCRPAGGAIPQRRRACTRCLRRSMTHATARTCRSERPPRGGRARARKVAHGTSPSRVDPLLAAPPGRSTSTGVGPSTAVAVSTRVGRCRQAAVRGPAVRAPASPTERRVRNSTAAGTVATACRPGGPTRRPMSRLPTAEAGRGHAAAALTVAGGAGRPGRAGRGRRAGRPAAG